MIPDICTDGFVLSNDAPAVFQFQLVAKNLEFFEHVIDPEEVVTWRGRLAATHRQMKY
jgi:hypothetical protein